MTDYHDSFPITHKLHIPRLNLAKLSDQSLIKNQIMSP